MSSSTLRRWTRVLVTVGAIVVVQTAVCGLAALPSIWFASRLSSWSTVGAAGPVLFATLLVPLYVLFALLLLMISPIANRLTGAYTPDGLRIRIADFDWPLLRWARYIVANHLVRLFAGVLFQGSPVWTLYLRLNGARTGRRTFVNTTAVSDHNLLTFGDDVVLGADVHLSGHTVEHGMLLTGRVLVGSDVTIGVGSIVSIGCVVADHCQVGALSFLPKHTTLDRAAVYAGVPVHRVSG